jgi:hypothetical protein
VTIFVRILLRIPLATDFVTVTPITKLWRIWFSIAKFFRSHIKDFWCVAKFVKKSFATDFSLFCNGFLPLLKPNFQVVTSREIRPLSMFVLGIMPHAMLCWINTIFYSIKLASRTPYIILDYNLISVKTHLKHPPTSYNFSDFII